jgi:hypothetical protein
MGLKLPFPKFLAKTDIKVYSTKINEDGEPEEILLYEGKCIYTDKSKQVLNSERSLITLTGKAVIEGDIKPGELIEGVVEVNNSKKTIYSSEKPLNPDGTVFSTELNLS